jgi:uncharacterized membrane protein
MFATLFAILATLLALDAVWLTLRAGVHESLFRAVQGGAPLRVRWLPAAIVYAIMTAFVYLYAVRDARSSLDAAARGALIGVLAYGFYDITNYATLTNYTLAMTLTDMAWGTALFTVAAAIGYVAAQK